MNTQLTEQQISSYRDHGFLVVRQFLGAAELSALRSGIDQAVAQLGRRKLSHSTGDRWLAGESFYDHVFVQRINLWKINATVKKYMLAPELGEMLCALEGIDGIRLWHDQTLQKQPWANPTAWHSDNPKWSYYSAHAISIWIALDPATLQNGCMYYLPGSHKVNGFEDTGIGVEMAEYFERFPQFSGVMPVAGEMAPGDAGFHNGLLAHAAGPNMTPDWRRAMTAGYMPDGSVFNGIQNVLSDAQVAALKVGDPLDDDRQNPLLWRRAGRTDGVT